MQCFKYRYLISLFRKIPCTCQSGRPGTDYGNLMPVAFRLVHLILDIFSVPVSHKTLQASDCDRFPLNTTHTLCLTLLLLRTYTAADSRQRACFMDDPIGFFKVAFLYLFDKVRNINSNRTAADAWLGRAMQTALRFLHCHFLCITQCYLIKIISSYLSVLNRHFHFF